jgi:hypothetical protein
MGLCVTNSEYSRIFVPSIKYLNEKHSQAKSNTLDFIYQLQLYPASDQNERPR